MPRRSKVDGLPAELKGQLERLLLDKTHGGYLALAAWLKEHGYEISHAAVHRYDQRLHAVMGRIRAAAEAAVLLNRAAPDDADEQGAATIRMVQASLFDALTQISDAQEADDAGARIKLLSAAARAVADASRASIGQKRWQDEVRSRVDAATTAGGITPETRAAIRAVLGIT